MSDKITLEKQVERFCRGLWQVCSSSVDISQDEEVLRITAFVRDMVLAEREACAKIADDNRFGYDEYHESNGFSCASSIAETIRNRSL